MRWWILFLLFLATVLNYIDRQTLSLLASVIQRVFHLDNVGYGNIVSVFLLSYTIAYVLTGPVCDRLGVRLSAALFICWWSLAELIPPLAHSAVALGASRFLLGIGEAGIWVAAPKVVGELFGPEQRALAIGLYTAGATVGAVVAPPLIISLTLRFDWQSAFFITGIAGLVWIVPWLFIYRDAEQPQAPPRGENLARPLLKTLLVDRNLWLLTAIRMVTDPLWYFFLFWYPKYLSNMRHLSLKHLGNVAWIVYLAADIGSIAGGWASGPLIRRHMQILHARRTVMTFAAGLILLTPLVGLTPSLRGTIIFASVVTFAHMAWLITLGAAVMDLFPQDKVATAFGIIAAGSGLGGLVSTQLIAHSLAHSGYLATFYVLGTLHPAALVAVYLLRDKRWRIDTDPQLQSAAA